MHILLVEGEAGEAREAEKLLNQAGHETYRCVDEDADHFPCSGMIAGECPLDRTDIDAAVLVRTDVADMPSAREDGARCALRHHIPLVLAGDVTASTYRPWATETTEDLGGLTDALERATAQLLDRHTRAATQSFHAVLAGHDLRPEIGTAEIHRSGGSLQVTLRVTEELPEGVAEVSAVRATGAVRDVDPYASTIDVEVVVAQ